MIELNKIYNADCLDILKDIPDKSIDLVLTDPPYGCGKDFENDSLPTEELTLLWGRVFRQCHRVLKENGNLLCEVPKNSIWHIPCFRDYFFEYNIVLETNNSMRNGKIGFNNYSLCQWFSKNGGRVYKRYRDIISRPLENTIGEFKHPSPKNVEHYKKLIDMFSRESDTILDPFSGSGTTAIACHNLNRKFICIEKDKEYFEKSVERYNKHIQQLKLPLDNPEKD